MDDFLQKLKWGAILGACVLAGLLLIVVSLTDEEATVGSTIFGCVCGLIFLALPTLLLVNFLKERTKNRTENKQLKKERKKRGSGWAYETVTKDVTDTERMLTDFRAHFREFFGHTGVDENSVVQSDVTQLFMSILTFRKRRLDRKGITLRFSSERKNYGTGEPVKAHLFIDGKYAVTEVRENIAAKTEFLRSDGKKCFSRTDTQVAHYALIDARRTGGDTVMCPMCGAKTTREQLIDGCDFCGTKFTVEDLGTKVAHFALRDDYDIQYAKYRAHREKFGLYVFLGTAVTIFVIGMILMLSMGKETMLEIGDGSILAALLAAPMAAAFAGCSIGLIFMYLFWFCVFPFIQIGASASHFTKKRLAQLKAAEQDDADMEALIRKSDPHFSIAGFWSGVQNKLAAVHYADTKESINAFSDTDLARYLDGYADVIDVDFENMKIEDFTIRDGYRQCTARVDLLLRTDDGRRVRSRREQLRLLLSKSAGCQTQAVCGPRVFVCKSCAASIPLTEGKTCPACGSTFDLKPYDWMITEYRVL